ncbi:DnaJ C-terminal domain-containing protein [Gordonibacter sp. Marseille-P4307]|uniref:DnaJ C-terminal domain-containing protein n=1 Tax=Gordonibacter sp. Marseille-P4307 TaxID=2161815 RepID=UPI000F544F52|nr:DnaJ C-terminal domain-containing protein [Gordonibacter sp. Marseille-P4307]
MESKPDYYKTLGVSRDASADDVKKAFRKLARTHHPDAGGDEARFKEINEAYEVLSDDKKRQMYDQFGTAEANGIPGGWGNVGDMFGGTVGWAEILESLRQGGGLGFDGFGGFGGFGGTARGPVARKGRDTNVTLSVTFDEAFKGAEKRVTVRVPGRSDKETLSVKVPAGAIDGGRLRFKGRGMPGENGGAAGDLFITTKIQSHEYFHRDGADVHIDVPISISEAALGASVVVPVPEGGRVRVKVPAGTQDGAVLTLKGKGAPRVKGSGSGDLKIKVGVLVPTELSDEQRSALEALAAAETKGIRPWE